MDEKVKKAIKGCKAAAVMSWIGCFGSAAAGVFGFVGSLAVNAGTGLFTVALCCGLAVFNGWMAKSISTLVSAHKDIFGDN